MERKLHHLFRPEEARGMDPIDLTYLESVLVSVWGLNMLWRVEVLGHGTNNQMMSIETPAGRYALRLYGNHADAGRVEVELQILAALEAQHLPFAVPSA